MHQCLVDSVASKIEWIVSVSMLSEGWDVKNVFQIVPHEERAFNSKLLIAQVLGRGLRRPDGWQGTDPIVTIFNHDAWAGRIKHLVDEILEIERRLGSRVLDDSPYHFDLHNLNYTRETDTAHFRKTGEYRLLQQGYVALPSQVEIEDVAIDYEAAVTGAHTKFRTQIAHKTYSFAEVGEEMYRRLQNMTMSRKTRKIRKTGPTTPGSSQGSAVWKLSRRRQPGRKSRAARLPRKTGKKSCRPWALFGARRRSALSTG